MLVVERGKFPPGETPTKEGASKGAIEMKKLAFATSLVAGVMMTAASAFPQNGNEGRNEGQGQAVITVLPAHDREATPANLSQQDLAVKINGKDSTITNWIPLRGQNDGLELVLLIDSSARSSMATQFGEIANFVNGLPATAKVAIAYMENGRAVFTGPLASDHAQALKGLHITGGFIGISASPYFSLSNLATHWPSNDRGARREVVMITDGVDYYNPRYDPEDPYMQAAITDSVRAGLVVYSIYWQNLGRFDRTGYATNAGQNLLLEVTQATGGNSYWEGYGNPVSFQPYFKDLDRRLQNQYEVSFTAPLKNKPEVESMKLKVSGISGKIDAPQQVFVAPSGM
jgi:hypothetical protein